MNPKEPIYTPDRRPGDPGFYMPPTPGGAPSSFGRITTTVREPQEITFDASGLQFLAVDPSHKVWAAFAFPSSALEFTKDRPGFRVFDLVKRVFLF